MRSWKRSLAMLAFDVAVGVAAGYVTFAAGYVILAALAGWRP